MKYRTGTTPYQTLYNQTMKPILVGILTFVVLMLIFYASIAYIALEPNLIKWDKQVRVAFVILFAGAKILGALAGAAVYDFRRAFKKQQ